ncbi:hypothetical protein CKA38_12865 [Ereboglobus luteus]|uniref:Uncharacterized protein n=2 Tax=Ereboglobus luteus TaxID=1796921 RepID=A0A2U8E645_9BACT|nr:hypothetical protein CKA38_12865 [Ereboglobus luteus]
MTTRPDVKPVEAVKKCWFRSNKTLSVTLQEFDQAYINCFKYGVDSIEDAKIKKREEDTALLKKRCASIAKMAKLYFKDIEGAYEKAYGLDTHTGAAVSFLDARLKAIVIDAEGRLSEAESMLREMKENKRRAKMKRKGARQDEINSKFDSIAFARESRDFCTACKTTMAYAEAACVRLLEQLHADVYEKSTDTNNFAPLVEAYNKHIRVRGLRPMYLSAKHLLEKWDVHESVIGNGSPAGNVLASVRRIIDQIEKWELKNPINYKSDFNNFRAAITSFHRRLLKDDIKPTIEKIKGNLGKIIRDAKKAK